MPAPILKQNATWTLWRLVREAQVLARVGSARDACDWLGSDDAGIERDETLCTYVNHALEEFLRDFPQLSLANMGLATTALDPFSSLPEDLHETDIYGIYWSGVNDMRKGAKVTPCSPGDIANLPSGVAIGQVYAEWPEYYSVLYSHAKSAWVIRWLPTPTVAKDFTIIYRAQPHVFAPEDLDSATNKIPVPDSQIEPLKYLVAERIQISNTGAKSPTPETLRSQYEEFRKKRAYLEPTVDEMRNAAFVPYGVGIGAAWEDKAAFESAAYSSNYGETYI